MTGRGANEGVEKHAIAAKILENYSIGNENRSGFAASR